MDNPYEKLTKRDLAIKLKVAKEIMTSELQDADARLKEERAGEIALYYEGLKRGYEHALLCINSRPIPKA